MKSTVLLFAIVVACLMACTVSGTRYYVHLKDGITAMSFEGGATAAATIDYVATMKKTGWDTLNVTTDGSLSDMDQAYAAGFGEGSVTQAACWNEWLDNFGAFQNGTVKPAGSVIPQAVATFINDNWAWMKAQVAANNATDNYWYQVGLQVRQWEGLLAGVNSGVAADKQMTFLQLQYTTLIGDLYDIIPALKVSQDKNWRDMNKREYDMWFLKKTHCSALIKLVQDLSDIYFGHATWSTFNTMPRIYKHYTLNYDTSRGALSKTISFSSYPGALSSIDDFYVLDTGIVLIETSLAVLNETMYEGNVVPQSLMYWVRVMVSARLATSGKDWVHTFAKYNSGTYNNQWMALDLNLFTPGEDLKPDTLWIAEQFPGIVGMEDVTPILQYGYWPSYNVPSIPSLFKAAGYAEAVEKGHWEMNDYQRCVRAQIFRRDQANVQDMPAYQFIMQYNDWEKDPISMKNPIYAVASRADLDPVDPQCFGAIDAKVSSYDMHQAGRQVLAYSGPTPQQPIFEFSKTNVTEAGCGPRFGMPDRWDFMWQRFQPFPGSKVDPFPGN